MQPEQRLMYPGQLNEHLRSVNKEALFGSTPFGKYINTTREFFTPTFSHLETNWNKAFRPPSTLRELRLLNPQGQLLFTIQRKFTDNRRDKGWEIYDSFPVGEPEKALLPEALRDKIYFFNFTVDLKGHLTDPQDIPELFPGHNHKRDKEDYLTAITDAINANVQQKGVKITVNPDILFVSDGTQWVREAIPNGSARVETS